MYKRKDLYMQYIQKELGNLLMKTEEGAKVNKEFNNEIDAKTKNYQKKYNFEIGTGNHATWNNESDAFKHAFMQAVLYHRACKAVPFFKDQAGNVYSKTLGDYHEITGKETVSGENNMDYWNNEVGREVAKYVREKLGKAADKLDDKYVEDMFAEEIMKRMKNGELITTPNDKRQYQDRQKYNKKSNNSGSQKTAANNGKGHWVTIDGNHVLIDD